MYLKKEVFSAAFFSYNIFASLHEHFDSRCFCVKTKKRGFRALHPRLGICSVSQMYQPVIWTLQACVLCLRLARDESTTHIFSFWWRILNRNEIFKQTGGNHNSYKLPLGQCWKWGVVWLMPLLTTICLPNEILWGHFPFTGRRFHLGGQRTVRETTKGSVYVHRLSTQILARNSKITVTSISRAIYRELSCNTELLLNNAGYEIMWGYMS